MIPTRLRERWKKYEKLMKTYEHSVIHGSATLDESYYHFAPDDDDAQKDRKCRNGTQVVTKLAKLIENNSGKDPDCWPILRVNQLWIWTIADSTYEQS